MADINKLIEANEFNRHTIVTFVTPGTSPVIHSLQSEAPIVTNSGGLSSKLSDLFDENRYYTGDTDS